MIPEADSSSNVRIESGRFRDAEVNLYAIVRDEMFFLDAFSTIIANWGWISF